MKKVTLLFLVLCFVLVSFSACDGSDTLIDPNFSANPFEEVEEGADLSESQLKAILSKVPDDKYESYPDLQNIPLSATLYKNGEEIKIEPTDKRLIALINLFNNSVYHSQCSYMQGYLSVSAVESYKNEDFRLELKYEPSGKILPGPYGKNTMMCDTILVSSSFTLINHDTPGYADRADEYPITAIVFSPLYDGQPWLELFGF